MERSFIKADILRNRPKQEWLPRNVASQLSSQISELLCLQDCALAVGINLLYQTSVRHVDMHPVLNAFSVAYALQPSILQAGISTWQDVKKDTVTTADQECGTDVSTDLVSVELTQ
jgi:hypothetical protein